MGQAGTLVDNQQREQALQAAREAFRPMGEVLFDEPMRIAPVLGGQRQPQAQVGDPDFAISRAGDTLVGCLCRGGDSEGGGGRVGAVGDPHALEVAQRPHAFVEAWRFSLAGSRDEQKSVAHGG